MEKKPKNQLRKNGKETKEPTGERVTNECPNCGCSRTSTYKGEDGCELSSSCIECDVCDVCLGY
jgi:hypothetical protein